MAPIDASFYDLPHPVLTKIGDNNTEPTFASILVAHVELNANAASIYSARGDGLQVHLALTINATDYIKRSIGNTPFVPPTSPAAVPTHLETASVAQIAETNRQHKVQKEEFILFHNADTALRNLLIAPVPPIFLADQRDPTTDFGNKTFLQLLTYLHTTFGSISEKELEQKNALMQLQWNPPTAIEALFLQFENGVSFATAGQDAPTKPTVLRWDYTIIEKTGRFDIACREWRQMDPSAKDLAIFKRHFKAADKDLRRLDMTGTDGFHNSAHSIQKTSTLLTTTQATLAASEVALARALSQLSLSSGSTDASAANILAITPQHQANARVATAGLMVTQPTVVTRSPHATIQEKDTKPTQPTRTRWVVTPTTLSRDFKDNSSESKGWQHIRTRLITQTILANLSLPPFIPPPRQLQSTLEPLGTFSNFLATSLGSNQQPTSSPSVCPMVLTSRAPTQARSTFLASHHPHAAPTCSCHFNRTHSPLLENFAIMAAKPFSPMTVLPSRVTT
jgi:hypothetical protein